MAQLLPFRGLRYSPAYRECLGRLVTPPYDVISCKDQRCFYRAHPHNIIRLELGQTRAQDKPDDNRYTRARKILQQWLRNGVLCRESKPALYILRSEYIDPAGRHRQFTGLLSRVQLEPLGQGSILPHERTYSGPKLDRLNLLKATGVSFSPVFAIYQDPSSRIEDLLHSSVRSKQDLDFVDWAGCRHRLWVRDDPHWVAGMQKAFARKTLLIADGHHRYSTALMYQQQVGRRSNPDADSVMMCLADMEASGLSVLPVYRLVNGVTAAVWRSFQDEIFKFFEVTQLSQPQALPAAQLAATRRTRQAVLGWLTDRGKHAYLLTPRPAVIEAFLRAHAGKHSPAYLRLDVVLLNETILSPLLGIRPGEEQGRLHYVKSHAEAQAAVAQGEAQAAFLPGLPDLNQIWKLAQRGETMPQKSTYFLPKLITGMVMNPVAL